VTKASETPRVPAVERIRNELRRYAELPEWDRETVEAMVNDPVWDYVTPPKSLSKVGEAASSPQPDWLSSLADRLNTYMREQHLTSIDVPHPVAASFAAVSAGIDRLAWTITDLRAKLALAERTTEKGLP